MSRQPPGFWVSRGIMFGIDWQGRRPRINRGKAPKGQMQARRVWGSDRKRPPIRKRKMRLSSTTEEIYRSERRLAQGLLFLARSWMLFEAAGLQLPKQYRCGRTP